MTAAATPILRLRNVESWFETPAGLTRALDGVSLDVTEGRAVGIVGESGSGKTQTFFSVFGLSQGWPGVVGGSAEFDGTNLLESLADYVSITPRGNGTGPTIRKDADRWNALHRRRTSKLLGSSVAILFQDPRRSFIPYWTIGRHIEEVVKRADGPAAAQNLGSQLLAQFGFRDPGRILKSFPEQLSGGEAQRAMLALTMAIRPRLLIADEPTTALDSINQMRVLAELQRVHAESRTTLVLISHDLAVVAGIVSYVFVMFGGRVVERAPVSLLEDRATSSLHPYTVELRESQKRRAQGAQIDGSVSTTTRVERAAVGCPYAPRCALRMTLPMDLQARCTSAVPSEQQVGADHFVSCWGAAS